MGCFSFLCKKTGKAVLSSSFSGSAVHLFLLKDGKVIEHMYGNYNSYGSVFKNTKDSDDDSCAEFSSFSWNLDWGDVCDLMFSSDRHNGIAAILATDWKDGDPYPNERSENDPNQGWGSEDELFGSFTNELDKWVENPYHKVY